MGVPANLLRVLRATREVSHAASHLADVAAEVTKRNADGSRHEEATAACLATARAAFRIDDSLRAGPQPEHLTLALESLIEIESAIRTARAALALDAIV